MGQRIPLLKDKVSRISKLSLMMDGINRTDNDDDVELRFISRAD